MLIVFLFEEESSFLFQYPRGIWLWAKGHGDLVRPKCQPGCIGTCSAVYEVDRVWHEGGAGGWRAERKAWYLYPGVVVC